MNGTNDHASIADHSRYNPKSIIMKNIFALSLIILLLSCFNKLHAQPGYLITIAGNGTYGFTGDGGPAIAAEIGEALGSIVVDSIGNVYFPDINNYRIRKVTPAGIISTIAGQGTSYADSIPATTAVILGNNGTIAIDIAGNLYFPDGNRVRKITMATGILKTVAGTDSAGYSGDGGPATSAELSGPDGICLDASGNLYISDGGTRVRKVNAAGIISTIAGTGTIGYSGDGGMATAAKLTVAGLCRDDAGNLYLADPYNNRIRKIAPSGIITTYAGSGVSGFSGDGGLATAACFDNPINVRMDGFGNLFIVDGYNARVRKVDPSGIITTFAGGGSSTGTPIPDTDALLIGIKGIGIDKYNNIYISDFERFKVLRAGPGLPTYSSDSFSVALTSDCTGLNFGIFTNSFSATKHVKTYFGDGTSLDTTLLASGSYASCNIFRPYTSGTYTIKHVLYEGTIPVDSITYTKTFLACQNLNIKFYVDENGDCIKDSTDPYFLRNVQTEVDSSDIAIDTVIATSGFNYVASGASGTVYSFKVLSTPAGIYVSCPSSGIVTDTVTTGVRPPNYVALACAASGSFDLAVNPTFSGAGPYDQFGEVFVSSTRCVPLTSTLTIGYSHKYLFYATDSFTSPTPSSFTDSTITWDFTGLAVNNPSPTMVKYRVWYNPAIGALTIGDTLHTIFTVTPFTGDSDTTNNSEIVVDTVKDGCDPNQMTVSPNGCINLSGTQIQYTIHFENTGNDTAFNIYVLDTLSPYVDPSTMKFVMTSAEMFTTRMTGPGAETILKFDFPGINLLDSSHHGLCDGAVIFTIDTKPGLNESTNVYNRAGIYFDCNDVVMTNQVDNIGCTATVGGVQTAGGPAIYPNPASDALTIKAGNSAFDSYIIANSVGQTVLCGQLAQWQTQVNISALSPGLYFVTIESKQGNVVRKFVKM